MRAALVTLTCLAAACFDPTVRPGISCGPAGECPGTLMCVAGVCGGSDGPTVDAARDDPCLDEPETCPDDATDAALVESLSFSRTSYPLAKDANCVAVADVNGDGNVDVLVGAGRTAGAALFLGSPAGTLGQRQDFPSDGLVLGVAIADMNGDSAPDLIVLSNDMGQHIEIHHRITADPPTFAAPTVVPVTAQSSEHLRVADVTGDGLPDPIVGGFMDTSLTLIPSDPANPGSYLAARTIPVEESGGQFAIGDLNGDDAPDIAFASMASAGWIPNSSATPGTFGALVTEVPAHGSAAAIGNFDGDTKPDLFYIGQNEIFTLLADADVPGAFDDPVMGTEPADRGPGTRLAVGDLNGDGRDDIVVPGQPNRIFLQTPAAPGEFAPSIGFEPSMAGIGAVALAFINDDDKLDMAVTNTLAGHVTIYLQQ